MRRYSAQSAGAQKLDAETQLLRRISGLERCIDRMIALPLEMRTNWWQGQLRYFQSEIAKLKAALNQLREHKV